MIKRSVNGNGGTVDVSHVQQQLTEWRREHKPPTPIPADLWAKAVALAERDGVGQTARTLGLDHAALKRRVARKVAPQPAPTFVELLTPGPLTIAECEVEVESSRGGRMRVTLRNIAPMGLSTIIRDFAG